MFKLVGTIKRIGDEQQISDQFVKREFDLETAEQYPQIVRFQMVQGNTAKLDDWGVGEVVKVHFNVRGREVEKEGEEIPAVYNSLDAWKITKPSE